MRAFRAGLLSLAAVSLIVVSTAALAQRAGPSIGSFRSSGGGGGGAGIGGGASMGPREPRDPRGPRDPGLGKIVPGVVLTIPQSQPRFVDDGDDGPKATGKKTQKPKQQAQNRRGSSGVPPAGERRYVPDEVVVTLRNVSADTITALSRRHRLQQMERQSIQLTGDTIVRWRIPDGRSVPNVIRALEGDVSIAFAQPNYISVLQEDAATAKPQSGSLQYAVGKLHLPQAHEIAKGANVLVAVIDSGIEVNHPELAGMIAASFNAEPGDTPHMHGTSIAGLIVAHSRLQGVAPSARILAVRAFGGSEGNTFSILKGIDWAAANGARIMNMSFAGPADPAIQRTLEAATKKGIILVAAAGNAGPKSPPLYPAAHANVIAVTATDAQDNLFAGANRGRHIAIAAPGVDVVAPALDGGYWVASGTSFAAAEISGVIALMLERKPDLTPAAVRHVLATTAKDLGPKGIDDQFGAGLADAYLAVTATEPQPMAKDTAAPVPVLSTSSGR